MRHAGRITEWHDEKGYGFVTPNGGGDRAFVHIKAMGAIHRRPTTGTLISYKPMRDGKGRLNATEVRFAGSRVRSAARRQHGFPSKTVAIGVLTVLAAAWYGGAIPDPLALLYAGTSLLALVLYGVDKSAARAGRQRTPENTLHLVAVLGGWPGALLAQALFRHKSRKQAFQVVFWITVALNLAGLAWVLSRGIGLPA